MNKLTISVSPHIRSNITTTKIMLDVVIALCPALIASVFIFGIRSLYITAVCVLTCILGELIFQLITKRELTIGDLSAVVTGMLLAFNLPVGIPEWQAIFGSLVAIIIVKQLFGGIGQNFANPAITARVVMLLSFSKTMTAWTAPISADAVSTATPLALISEGNTQALPSLMDMFLGNRAGCLGETCALALLLGGAYLIIRRVITWHIPVMFIGTVFVLSFIAKDFSLEAALYQLMSGGLIIGAFFMATDYTTSPPTPAGKIIFGICCGLITVVIRLWGSYPEGVSFSILLMNIIAPYISSLTARKPFGGIKNEKR